MILARSRSPYYAKASGLTTGRKFPEINELGGKRERKYPTTLHLQSFDPETRDLKCSYHVDNIKNYWPLHLRVSEDGRRLVLIGIGGSSS